MRKITALTTRAFMCREKLTVGDTYTDGDSLYLFGNRIAWHNPNGTGFYITNCGWETNTTKDRLNGLPGVSIYHKRNTRYLNGHEWNGSPILIGG